MGQQEQPKGSRRSLFRIPDKALAAVFMDYSSNISRFKRLSATWAVTCAINWAMGIP
jgi:hypothetical protein